MKKLIHYYNFQPSSNTVIVNGVYKPERFLLITNVTTNQTIFTFNSQTAGITSISYDYPNEETTLVLDYDCSAMSASDKLQIFVEMDSSVFEPSETFVDPVSKIRVSEPSNLIDTDFEYGLQSTKWETLERVKNIPTFFSRNGDTAFAISEMTTTNGSDIVSVTLSETHNFLPGSPVIIAGSKNITCDGSFIVTNVISTTQFQYKAKALQNFTGSIKDTFTQVFAGSLYTGTEFDISGIEGITTDGQPASSLTVSTTFPINFEVGTSFFLSNSKGAVNISANGALVEPDNYNDVQKDVTNNVATGDTGFAIGAVQPYDLSGTEALYFVIGTNATVNVSTDTITFTSSHGLIDNETYLYVNGDGNTLIGGLTDYVGYYVRVLSTTEIYFTATSGGTARVNLTTTGANGGIIRSALIRGYRATTASTASSAESIAFNRAHGLTSDSNQPLVFFNGTSSNLTTSSNLVGTYTVYYPKTIRSTTALSFTASPGGAQIGLSTATANSVMIKAAFLPDSNSMYFANHGLNTNDIVTYTVLSGSTPTGGLTSGTAYTVEKVSDNRIRFKDTNNGVVINLLSAGSAAAEYRVVSRIPEINNDAIYAPNVTLSEGALVVYNNNGNADIGGLTNGTSYYAFQNTQDYFKLSTTSTGWTGTAKSVTHATAINTSTNVITLASHGYATGTAVQYTSTTPANGLKNGAWYWVRSLTANTFTLHWTSAGAAANTFLVDLAGPLSGTGSFRSASLVDITAVGTGTHIFTGVSANAVDGVYTLTEKVSDTTFKIAANNQIPLRSVNIDPTIALELNINAFYVEDHGLLTGTPVTYNTTGTAIGGLTDTNVYYVARISKNWFKLSSTEQDALDGVFITITSKGTGTTHTLSTSSISGEVKGTGTVSIQSGYDKLTGTGTNFSAVFTSGNVIKLYQPQTFNTKTVLSVNASTNIIETSAAHSLSTGNAVRLTAASVPGGLVEGGIYYVRVATATTVSLHPTPADAAANTNILDITTTGSTVVLNHIVGIGSTTEAEIRAINSANEVILRENVSETFTDAEYALGTSLLLRADGFALHRPYDGGVELIPSTNPDSTMIRQTRRYFRYQSGKGIQVSFAVNFSPSTTIDTMTANGSNASVVTRLPHRLTQGLNVVITGAEVTSGQNYWNGTFEVQSVPDPYTFNVTLSGTPVDVVAQGLVEYNVNSWSNSLLKCGLFDDQNGLFFEYDGNALNCVRRSGTQQISGVATVSFKSGAVIGTNTKFMSQLSANDKLIIKGQTYVISKIASNTLLYILPSYRGVDAANVVLTKVVDTKVPQSQWNLDTCDGTGPTGYVLNINKIQMAYMDYSWYGAGKVRFGFKDQRGKVIYVHEFIHNNKFTEAYMRSGNIPARYEIENIGVPTYVPALAHWGTSVIMDGKFDDDRSYVFNASSNNLSILGSASLTISGSVESIQNFYVFDGSRYRLAGPAVSVATPSSSYNTIPAGVPISGTGVNTTTANPLDTNIVPFQSYLPSVVSRYGTNPNNFGTQATRNLLLLNSFPASTATTTNYTVTLSSGATSVVYEQPLISIRLAPSVDNGTPGLLGEREILNRMQLILNSVGVLTTHTCEVILKLNGSLNNYNWKRVTNPSLSQLVYHSTSDTIVGGTTVFTFRAGGDSGTTARRQINTVFDLDEIATLGNSILGGDNVFPDGPDVLTVVVKLLEDPSAVTSTNPFSVGGRISWSESQA